MQLITEAHITVQVNGRKRLGYGYGCCAVCSAVNSGNDKGSCALGNAVYNTVFIDGRNGSVNSGEGYILVVCILGQYGIAEISATSCGNGNILNNDLFRQNTIADMDVVQPSIVAGLAPVVVLFICPGQHMSARGKGIAEMEHFKFFAPVLNQTAVYIEMQTVPYSAA